MDLPFWDPKSPTRDMSASLWSRVNFTEALKLFTITHTKKVILLIGIDFQSNRFLGKWTYVNEKHANRTCTYIAMIC